MPCFSSPGYLQYRYPQERCIYEGVRKTLITHNLRKEENKGERRIIQQQMIKIIILPILLDPHRDKLIKTKKSIKQF